MPTSYYFLSLSDQHIVDCIGALLQQGKNVFVVSGHTHAVMQPLCLLTVRLNS